MAICTKLEQINTVNVELLILCAKNLVRWMEGWKDVKAGLRIAYSNQKLKILNFKFYLLVLLPVCFPDGLAMEEEGLE